MGLDALDGHLEGVGEAVYLFGRFIGDLFMQLVPGGSITVARGCSGSAMTELIVRDRTRKTKSTSEKEAFTASPLGSLRGMIRAMKYFAAPAGSSCCFFKVNTKLADDARSSRPSNASVAVRFARADLLRLPGSGKREPPQGVETPQLSAPTERIGRIGNDWIGGVFRTLRQGGSRRAGPTPACGHAAMQPKMNPVAIFNAERPSGRDVAG